MLSTLMVLLCLFGGPLVGAQDPIPPTQGPSELRQLQQEVAALRQQIPPVTRDQQIAQFTAEYRALEAAARDSVQYAGCRAAGWTFTIDRSFNTTTGPAYGCHRDVR